MGAKFDVADARCYDPNEEVQLRHVIDELGASHFNTKIHASTGVSSNAHCYDANEEAAVTLPWLFRYKVTTHC